MLALKVIFLIVTIFTNGVSNYQGSRDEESCYCGYGGLCAKTSQLHIIKRLPCKKICPEVSGGFYEDDCNTIVNHCSSSPCGTNGTCIQTFGGYFCVCHRDYYGKNCEIHYPLLTELDFHQAIYVHYQVQTIRRETNFFSVVYDPSLSDQRSSNLEIQVVVNISDGRSYYPRASEHFKPMAVKSECMAEAEAHPLDIDKRVCGFLPSGALSTFTFDPTHYGPVGGLDVVEIDGFGVVGVKGNLTVFLFLVERTSNTIVETLYSQTYRIFTYRRFRVQNQCLLEITFTSCSSNHRLPYVHARGAKISLSVIRNHHRCSGSLYVGYQWNIQRHTDSIKPISSKDFMPVPIKNDNANDEYLAFLPLFFDSGVHMIEYELIIRGRPPHYGATSQFHTYGRCWIHIITHPPILRVVGGEMQSVSCYGPMTLALENFSDDININSIQFEASCNDTVDPECDRKPLKTPAIQKYNTACNTYLKFTVKSRNMKTDLIFVYVYFTNNPSSMKIECISNCFPINPHKRTLLVATTERYIPSKVTWIATRDGVTIEERDGQINAFTPSTATRFIRINGDRFCNPDTELSNVKFHTAGLHNMQASVSTVCVNLKVYINDFKLVGLDDGKTLMFKTETPKNYKFSYPVVYRIFQREPRFLADIQVAESNYVNQLTFTAFWPQAQICVYDTYDIFECTDWKDVPQRITPNVSLAELNEAFMEKDYGALLEKSFIHLALSVEVRKMNGKPAMAWTSPPSQRLIVLKLLNKIPSFKKYGGVVYAVQIAVSQFLSSEGSNAERLIGFVDEDLLTDVATTITHLQLRHESLTLLDRMIQTRYSLALEDPELGYGPFEFGDLRSLLHFTLVLAYIQGGYIRNLGLSTNQTVARRVQAGLVTFWMWKNSVAYISAVKWYLELVVKSTRLFNGIAVYGRYFSRAWAVRTTYKGILEAFSRGPTIDNFQDCASYIFDSQDKPGLEWLDYMRVDLPPSTVDWEYKEITLIVVAEKNRKNDTTVSPILLLLMHTKKVHAISDLPDGKPFNITLPRMWGGVMEPSRHKYISFLITRGQDSMRYVQDSSRQISAFKIELPVEFDSWTVELEVNVIVPLKFMVTSVVPDPEILANIPNIYPTYDAGRGKFLADVKLTPEAGKNFIPKHFYLGVSPSFETTPYNYIILTLQRTTDVCFVDQKVFSSTEAVKRWICKGLTADPNTIQCNCNKLGVFQAGRQSITINKLLLSDIPFIMPIRLFVYENIAITAALVLFFMAVLFFSIRKDRLSQKQDTLIYVEDNYPSDGYLLVIGVYTGLYYQGGTTSKVGIMLIGEDSSSRVHILVSPRRRTLGTGRDDWFVIALPEQPGKITHINLWRDYNDLSGWFCDRITVYDVSESRYYVAIIEKWIRLQLTQEVPRLEVIEVQQQDLLDNRTIPHGFWKNYVREFRNTHDLISISAKHPRCLLTREVGSHMIVVRWCFIYFWIWFNQVFDIDFLKKPYFGADFTGNNFDLGIQPFIAAFWAALISHPISFAIEYYYRLGHLSRVIQKKTTNPFYQSSLIEKRRMSNLSRRASTKAKKSSFGKSRHSKASIAKSTKVVFKFTSNVSGIRKGGIRLAVGPTQFRCVDVSSETIAMKIKRSENYVRLASCLVLVAFLSFMIYVQFYTHFTWKWEMCLATFARAIFIDVFLLGPLLICMKSAIAFYVHHVSNRETFLMSEDVKVHQPLRTKYENYLELATKKEYKLPLSTDIQAAKRKLLIRVTAKRVAFQILTLLAMYCAFEILMDKYGIQHFILMQTLKDSMTSAGGRHGLESVDPQDVYDFSSATLFVSNTIATLTGIWPNGKNIKSTSASKGKNVRWTYDHFGLGRGSSSVLLLYINDLADRYTTPLEFEEYYTNGTGYYSESMPERAPLLIGDTILNFTILNDAVITGKTSEVYPFAGHLKLIPLKNWEVYYSQMRILMSDVIDKRAEHDCRAMIITTNYVYPFVQYLVTIDVLIEFLPSGFSQLYIQTLGIKTGAPSHYRMSILRSITVATLALFSVYTVIVIFKVGPTKYFRDLNRVTKFLIFFSNLATTICFFLRFPLKYGEIETINNATEAYRDLHAIYLYELADTMFLVIFIWAILIDFLLMIPQLIGTVWLKEFCVACIRSTLIIATLQLYLMVSVAVATDVSNSFGYYFVVTHTSQPPKNVNPHTTKEGIVFYVSMTIGVIMSKFVLAFMISIAHSVKDGRSISLKNYINILRRKPLDTHANNFGGYPIATMFHGDLIRDRSSPESTVDQRSQAMSLLSERLSTKHRLF